MRIKNYTKHKKEPLENCQNARGIKRIKNHTKHKKEPLENCQTVLFLLIDIDIENYKSQTYLKL
jgi:hypothetical protein